MLDDRPDPAGDRFDAVCILQPTTPLRRAADIDRCVELLETSGADAVVTMLPVVDSKDVLVGKRGFIDRQSNVQIVDWRNAPVSRIYYRYEEGDDYEEEIAGRRVEGMVEARRNVSIARGNLRRIGSPQGTYLKDSRGAWVQAVGDMTPILHGGMGKAARPVAAPGVKGVLGVHHAVVRPDKALPEIAALIDKEQFELITQPGSGIVVIQGGAGSGTVNWLQAMMSSRS